MDDLKPFLSIKEVASYLGLSVSTVNRYIKDGRLKAYRFGNIYRIKKDDYLMFLSSCIFVDNKTKVDREYARKEFIKAAKTDNQ